MLQFTLLALLTSVAFAQDSSCGKVACTPYLNVLEGCTNQVGITSNVTLLQSCICPNGTFDEQVKTCYACAQTQGIAIVTEGIGLYLNFCANYTGSTTGSSSASGSMSASAASASGSETASVSVTSVAAASESAAASGTASSSTAGATTANSGAVRSSMVNAGLVLAVAGLFVGPLI